MCKDEINQEMKNKDKMTFGKYLDFHVEEAEENYTLLSLEVRDDLLNPGGTLHGGALVTLADDAMGLALRHIPSYTTMDIDHRYLRAARSGDRILAEAKLVKNGRTIIIMECKMYNQKEELIGLSTASYFRLKD